MPCYRYCEQFGIEYAAAKQAYIDLERKGKQEKFESKVLVALLFILSGLLFVLSFVLFAQGESLSFSAMMGHVVGMVTDAARLD